MRILAKRKTNNGIYMTIEIKKGRCVDVLDNNGVYEVVKGADGCEVYSSLNGTKYQHYNYDKEALMQFIKNGGKQELL